MGRPNGPAKYARAEWARPKWASQMGQGQTGQGQVGLPNGPGPNGLAKWARAKWAGQMGRGRGEGKGEGGMALARKGCPFWIIFAQFSHNFGTSSIFVEIQIVIEQCSSHFLTYLWKCDPYTGTKKRFPLLTFNKRK